MNVHWKAPPWKFFLIICALLGLTALIPAQTNAATKCPVMKIGSAVAHWLTPSAAATTTIVALATDIGGVPQEVMLPCGSSPTCQTTCTMASNNLTSDATKGICFGHCNFSAIYAMEIPNNATGEGSTFATKMTTSDGGDPAMAVALIPTTITAGNTNADAVLRSYISTKPVRFDPAAYTSEGATRRNTGHASMYAEVSPTFRFASPLSMKARYSRQPDRATRASPAHSTFNRRPLSRYC